MTLPKTSHQCDARQEDLQICTPRLNINGSTSSTTTKYDKASVNKKEASTSMANHDPRMNRTTPNYHALSGIVGT
jgi:hypothetical protein